MVVMSGCYDVWVSYGYLWLLYGALQWHPFLPFGFGKVNRWKKRQLGLRVTLGESGHPNSNSHRHRSDLSLNQLFIYCFLIISVWRTPTRTQSTVLPSLQKYTMPKVVSRSAVSSSTDGLLFFSCFLLKIWPWAHSAQPTASSVTALCVYCMSHLNPSLSKSNKVIPVMICRLFMWRIYRTWPSWTILFNHHLIFVHISLSLIKA